jgi:enoyl-CoA hydratase
MRDNIAPKTGSIIMSDEQDDSRGPLYFEEVEPGIGVATMNRPEKLNAINPAMIDAFEELYDRLTHHPSVRVLVLTGAGRGFCSGADLTAVVNPEAREVLSSAEGFLFKAQERFSNLVLGLRRLPQPVIAAVNGPAAGGGFALALGSDIRLAAPEAYFVASFINIGLSAGEMGSSYLLPRLVGMSRASEILFTGRKAPAEEAEKIGLVNRIVPNDRLMTEALDLARIMLGKSRGGLLFTKSALNQNAAAPSLEAAVELENRNQTILAVSSEFFKQVSAFGK